MNNGDMLDSVLTIGCHYTPPKGGIAQTLYIYDHYIYPQFRCIVNSTSKGKLMNVWLLLYSLVNSVLCLLIDKKIRIVHIHTASNLSFYRSVLFVLLGKIFRRKVLLHIHGGAFLDFYKTAPRFVSWGLRQCDRIIVLSEGLKKQFSELVPSLDVRVIRNAVEPPALLKNPERDDLVHFLFLGVIKKEKGLFDLLEAMSRCKGDLRGKFILHVGGGGNEIYLQKMIEEKGLSDIVVFEGWVEGERKQSLLGSSDVFILPSYVEGLPITILEAMSHGLAVIATSVGAIPEIISPKGGILITPGDLDALVDAIRTLLRDERLRSEMGAFNRLKVKPFHVKSVRQELELLYRDVLFH